MGPFNLLTYSSLF